MQVQPKGGYYAADVREKFFLVYLLTQPPKDVIQRSPIQILEDVTALTPTLAQQLPAMRSVVRTHVAAQSAEHVLGAARVSGVVATPDLSGGPASDAAAAVATATQVLVGEPRTSTTPTTTADNNSSNNTNDTNSNNNTSSNTNSTNTIDANGSPSSAGGFRVFVQLVALKF